MRNRENAPQDPQPQTPRVVEFRRREVTAPQSGAIERKLQADVTAWLRQRHRTR
ncbi:MAG: hypothetical protein HZB55_05515 [Deltaproteobacteria bacterium]|nr:hypothetical protein [Deltaproteobacteria bacterium]